MIDSLPVKCQDGFASKVRIHCWTQSVPPRGSGWVRTRSARFAKFAAHAPTRYREVVLTVSKSGFDFCGSGWVRSRSARFAKFAAHAPTRYREVVLTLSKSGSDF